MKRTTLNAEKTSFISLLVISSLVFVPLSAAAGHNSEANQKDQSRGASDGHEASRGKEAKPDPHQTNPGSRWPGVGISVDLSRLFGGQKKAPDLPKMLDKEGPQFPDVLQHERLFHRGIRKRQLADGDRFRAGAAKRRVAYNYDGRR